MLGWLDGALDVEGLWLGMEDGWPETLGDSDGAEEGAPLAVGLKLG